MAAPVARTVTTRLTIDARGWVAGGQIAQRSMRATSQAAQQGAREAIKAFREQQVAQERAAAASEKAAQRAAREQTRSSQQAARAAEKASRDQSRAAAKAAADAERAAHKQSAAFEDVGTKVGAAGLAIGAGLAYGVKKSADFEAAMSGAAAATQLHGKALEALEQTAIRAGASTQYSATEAANGITEMAKAGISAADIMGGGLTGALNLAAAGQLGVADAAEIAASMMTQFKLAGQDLPHVADLLAAGAGKAQGSVQDMGLAMTYVGPVAAGLGVSIEETTGAVAELARSGIVGEKAGTGLRGMLMSLTAPSKAATREMDSLGIKLYDASGHFIGVRGAAQELHRTLGPLDEATRNAALGQIFGNEQIVAARIFYEGGGRAVDEWTAKVNDAGFAARQAATLTDNLKGDVERLGGAFDTALIGSGSASNGVLREMVQQATGLLDIYNTLPQPVQTAGTAFLGIASAVGLASGGLLLAAPRIKATKDALNDMGRVGAGLQRGLSGVAGVLGGPWGIALGAATIGLGIWADKHADAVKREQDFRAALDQTTGAMTEQAVALAARNLQESGAFKAARELGIATDLVTQAATGNTTAQATLTAEMRARYDATRLLIGASDEEKYRNADAVIGAQKQRTALEKLRAVVGSQTRENADAVAKQKELGQAIGATAQATVGGAEAVREYAAATTAAEDPSTSIAAAIRLIGRGAKASDQEVQDLAKSMDDWQRKVTDAFDSATDVLGNFSGKAGASASDTAAQMRKSYRDTIRNARQFVRDIETVTRRGLNPAEVASLLEQGPEKAGPVLRAMVSDHSGRLIKMVNESRDKLGKIQERVAEQARLTDLAVRSSNDRMTAHLGDAMRIAEAKARAGGHATARALSKELGIGQRDVERISRQFGISLDRNVEQGTTAARRNIGLLDAKIRQLPDGHATEFTTPGLAGATGDVETLRAKLADLARRDKINVTVAVGIANKIAAGSAGPTGGRGDGYGDLSQPVRRAGGGPVSGPGGPRDDAIPALLSNREWVHPVDAVDRYGPRFMRAVQTGQFPVELAQAFANGGQVAIRGAVDGSVAGALKPVADALRATAATASGAGDTGGGPIGGAGGANAMGYQRQMAILRGQFPGISLTSGFRPGAITATGNRSYHSMGRAVDIPPRMAYFDWIRSNYGRQTRELIFSPAGGRQLWNGRPHMYTGVTRSMHFDHVHWAMNRGGQVGSQDRSRPAARYSGGWAKARGYASGGQVLGADYSGISSIVTSRVTVTADEVRTARKATDDAEHDVRVATRDLAKARRELAKAHTKAEKKAAEDDLEKATKTLAHERLALSHRQAEQSTRERDFRTGTRPLATRYHEAATTRNRVTAGFLRNLQTLASRGFGDLARQLSEMGGAEAETLAGQAVASTRTARTLQADFTRSARLEAQAETLPARLAITSALRTMRNPTLAGLSRSSGIATADLQTAALAMRGSLGRNANARALLSGLGTNTTAGGFTPAGGGDQIVVQVASTGNPWLDGERAMAGAKRVTSVGSSRRF